MIGNDIVDLKVASRTTRWDDQRFPGKVFSNHEQDFVRKATDPFKTIWILWSMKESAYKVYIQSHSKRHFNPSKLECQLTSSQQGIVRINREEYITSSVVNENYIYSMAVKKNDPWIWKHIQSKSFTLNETSYSHQHDICYQKIIYEISESLQTPRQHLSIIKDQDGIPFIYYKDIRMPVLLTITHHGSFGAYAWLKISL